MNILVIENPDMMCEIVFELKSQIEGYEGRFMLSENQSEMKIDSLATIVIDPFAVDLNQKDLLSKLYAKMKMDALSEDEYLLTNELLAEIMRNIQRLMNRQPVILDSAEADLSTLFRYMGISFAKSESLLETLQDYVDVCSEYRGIRLFIFVNLKSYLSDQDVFELYRHLIYTKKNVLLIEHTESKYIEGEVVRVIDSDLCEVTVFSKKYIH